MMRITLPILFFVFGLMDNITFVQENLDAALYKITGVTRKQHTELINEFLTQMQHFPTINVFDLLRPSKLAEYLGHLCHFGKSVVTALVVKGQAFADVNKIQMKAPNIGKIIYFLQIELYEALLAVTGLTKKQRKELMNEFSQQMKNFPSSGGCKTDYLKDFHKFGKNVVNAIVTKARVLAVNNNSKGPIEIESPVLCNLIDDLKHKLNYLLAGVTGLSSSQRDRIVEELLQSLREFSNVLVHEFENYIKKIQDFAEKMIAALVVKAKSLVDDGEAAVQR